MKHKKNILFLMALMAAVAFCLSACASDSVSQTEFSLDTVNTFTFYGTKDETLLKKPIARLRALDKKVDAYDTDSEVSQINQNAGIRPVKVSRFTYNVIAESLRYSKASDGLFDVTSGPLIDLWQIDNPKTKSPPSDTAINAAKAKIDYHHIVLNKEKQTVYLTQKGMALNLGAIAKGAIGSNIKKVCSQEGVTHGLLNLGGSVVLIGGKTDREGFSIGITDPHHPNKSRIGTLTLKNTAVETSGDYERYFKDASGKKYHHILDPKTGYPADTDLHQVTVVAQDATACDALSTMFFLMGSEKSRAYLKSHPKIAAIFVTKDNRVLVSKSLKKQFSFNRQLSKYRVLYV